MTEPERVGTRTINSYRVFFDTNENVDAALAALSEIRKETL